MCRLFVSRGPQWRIEASRQYELACVMFLETLYIEADRTDLPQIEFPLTKLPYPLRKFVPAACSVPRPQRRRWPCAGAFVIGRQEKEWPRDTFGEVCQTYLAKSAFQSIHLARYNVYVITKSNAQALERKLRVFRARSGRRQTLFLTMITPHGIATNRYSTELVTYEVVLNDLFAT